ncbi:hypothetical protein EDB83DRAFT_2523436 [Lactarius deliciosus]|nr:hypothetical protein EDB83DRAFT_2523436 [Lactarius deliciosus]
MLFSPSTTPFSLTLIRLRFEPDTFPTPAATYAKFRAAPKRARPFATTLISWAPCSTVSVPDLAALARGPNPSIPTRIEASCESVDGRYVHALNPAVSVLSPGKLTFLFEGNLLLDTHPEHVATNPENAIILKSWKGEPGDKGLIEFIPFLESIGIYKPPDVRAILKAYESKHIPLEYAEKEAESKRAFIEEWKARGGGKGLSRGGFTVSSLFTSNSEKVSTLSVLPLCPSLTYLKL